MTLEETLTASLAIAQARKAAPRAETAAPEPTVSGETEARPGLFIMPAPPPEARPARLLSPSSVNEFMGCQMRWYYRKILELPETRGAALGLGTAVHEAIAENFRQKIETREDLPTDGVRALFIGALIRQLDEIVLERDESADDLKDVGETMVRVFMDRAAPAIDPAGVEVHVEGKIGDVDAHGYIDILTTTGQVIDLKTAARKPSGVTPAQRLQVATYAMLSAEAAGGAKIVTLTKTKTVGMHEETIEVLPRDRRYTESMYSIARDQMDGGVYAPNRGAWFCSKRHCSFHVRCAAEFGGQVAD